MPNFRYAVLDEAGQRSEGLLAARDRQAAADRLQAMGKLPVEIAEASAGRAAGGRRPGRRDVTLLTREFAMLLRAGQTVEQALQLLSGDGAGPQPVQRLAAALLEEVRSGQSLSAALERHPGAFPPIYVGMVRAAELSGTLEAVVEQLAAFRERSDELRERTVGALVYPAVLVVTSIASVLLLLALVVPQFERIFESAGAALPASTAVVIAAGRWVQDNGLLLLGVAAGAALAMRAALRRPWARAAWDGAMLRLPLLRGLVGAAVAARLARTLGTLLANGVELPSALALTRDVMGNVVVQRALDEVLAAVRQGSTLSDPLGAAGFLPPLARQMVRVGEETARLDAALLHVATVFERKLEMELKRLFTLLEPVLIIGLGVVIGGIILSILTAVIGINDLAF